jgi:3-oxoacyl-[acyl-carrier protein] reductase
MIIKDKVALVTGGASGIGKSIVDMLLEAGVMVAILDFNRDTLDSLGSDPNMLKLFCDITKESDVARSVKQVLSSFGKIDILINNAGALYSAPLINLTAKDKRHSVEGWQKVIDVNLTAPLIVSSYVAEHMVINRIKGVIVNISSISAKGNRGQSAYSAAKAGLESMTRVWAKELGGFGIRSVALAPGFMDTQSTSAAVNQSILDHVKKETPLSRLGNAGDIAHAVKFIIENNFINGKTIEIDGGLTI